MSFRGLLAIYPARKILVPMDENASGTERISAAPSRMYVDLQVENIYPELFFIIQWVR
jgi:hypothetical protein